MNTFASMSLLSFVVAIVLANIVWRRDPRNAVNRTFTFFCVIAAYLSLAEFGLRQADSFPIAYLWSKAAAFWPIIVPVLLHFVLTLTGQTNLLRRKLTYVILYVPALVFTALGLTTELLSTDPVKEYWGWTDVRTENALSYIANAWSTIVSISALFLCLRYYIRTIEPVIKQRAKYILIGISIPLLSALISEVTLPIFHLNIPGITTPAFTLGALFIGYGIYRYRLFALTAITAAEHILSAMSHFLFLVSPEGKIMRTNQAALAALGYKEEELIGQDVSILFAEEEKGEALFKHTGLTGQLTSDVTKNTETTMQTKLGEHIPTSVSTSTVRSEDGRAQGIVCIAEDITERKQMEEVLRKAHDELEVRVEKRTAELAKANEELQVEIIERKRMEEALRDSEEKLRKMFESATDGVLVVDLNGVITEANQRTAEMHGFSSKDELLGKSAIELVAPHDRERITNNMGKAIKEGTIRGVEYTLLKADGSEFPAELSSSVLRDASGNPVGHVTITRDITERKKREQLQNAENHVLTLLEQGAELNELLDAIVRLGEQNDPSIKGSVLLFDSSKKLLFQVSAPRLPDDYQELFANGVPTGPKAGSCGTAAYLKERVIVKDIENSPLFKPFEEVVKRAVNNNLLAVWSQPIISSNGDLLGTIANYSNKVGEPSADNLRALEWSARIAAIAIERKQVEQERERLLQQLEDSKKELEQIIYVTSHDLRSPLVNVQGFTRELEHALQEVRSATKSADIPPTVSEKLAVPMDEDIPDALRYILTSTSKIDSLLSGLLRLSRLGRAALNMENLDMNELMADVVHAFEFNIKEAGVKLEIEDLPSCHGDKTQINQVFSNLIDNALKYLDPNRPGIIRVSGKKEDGQAIYCVQDNGIGIAPEYQQRVFEIFQRLDPKANSGEGLGLTIVRRILDRHSGKIWLESKPGKGSKFFVSLLVA